MNDTPTIPLHFDTKKENVGRRILLHLFKFFVIPLFLGSLIMLPAVYIYINSGPSFIFDTPEAITLINNEELTEHKVEFPKLMKLIIPYNSGVSSDTAFLKEGDILEVNLDLLENSQVTRNSIKVYLDTGNFNFRGWYFFSLSEALHTTNGIVRIQIDSVEKTVSKTQKSLYGTIYTLKEIYNATPMP